MHFNGMEFLILKWTFGAIFLGATALFLAKIGILLFLAGKAKVAAFMKMYPLMENIVELFLQKGAVK